MRAGARFTLEVTASPGQTFLERSRYYLGEEYPVKIRQCVLALPNDALWKRANESSNSIANLLLHLTGNVRQWIVLEASAVSQLRVTGPLNSPHAMDRMQRRFWRVSSLCFAKRTV